MSEQKVEKGAAGLDGEEFRHAMEPQLLRSGHSFELLVDGDDIFASMLDALRQAQESIWLETYIFESDKTGGRFIEVLAERARAGVEVLVVVDAVGGIGLDDSDVLYLEESGAKVRFFGRLNHIDLRRWLKRDHRKLLLIDQHCAFVGGININDDYASKIHGGKGWHEYHLRCEGPVCASLARCFARTWHRLKGRALPVPAMPSAAQGGEWAMVLRSNHSGTRMQIRAHVLHALRQAKSQVLLAFAYFVPDRGLIRALCETARRGVEVRILVPANSDLASVQLAGEYIYERLLAAGVHVHSWQDTHMHVKAAVVDRRWCLFGSYNLDFFSLIYNLELVVEVIGETTPVAIADQLGQDFAKSPEIQLGQWRSRPLKDKALSKIAYQFRWWL